ncbi:hypothetical protein, partial [Shigella sonnei]|uniref:hypothetical protein n=1 Tax=Shigella sonnei TaxID=624 RepID=UPI001C0A703E
FDGILFYIDHIDRSILIVKSCLLIRSYSINVLIYLFGMFRINWFFLQAEDGMLERSPSRRLGHGCYLNVPESVEEGVPL